MVIDEDFESNGEDDELHATRRQRILTKYPEIQNLYGPDPSLKFVASGMVLIQFGMLFLVKDMSSWPLIILLAYSIGGVLNHGLAMAIHETSHERSSAAYRYFRLFWNLPIGLPISTRFIKDHEGAVGNSSELEAKLFCSSSGRLIWLILQLLLSLIKPLKDLSIPISNSELSNLVIQILFNISVINFFGLNALIYLISGSLLATGFHPIAGHLIAEQYRIAKGLTTYSYYGPFSWLTFNAGLYNERNDFPLIPGRRLSLVREIAPEFYVNLPQHNSWTTMMYDFITDPAIGSYAKEKSRIKGQKVLRDELWDKLIAEMKERSKKKKWRREERRVKDGIIKEDTDEIRRTYY